MKSAQLRERLGLTRGEWARVLNVHERTVARWEVEERDPGGTATAVMQGNDKALSSGARLDFVRNQLAFGISTLVSASLSLTAIRR